MSEEFALVLELKDLRKGIREDLKILTSEETTDRQVWAWIHDPLNIESVKALAGALIVEQRRQARRIKTRERERLAQEKAHRIQQAKVKADKVDAFLRGNGRGFDPRDLIEIGIPERHLNLSNRAVTSTGSWRLVTMEGTVPFWKGDDWLTTIEGREWAENNPRLLQVIRKMQAAFNAEGERWSVRKAEMDAEFSVTINAAINKYSSELRAAWDAEMLAQTFVVDGVEVAWGDASIQQHESRIAWLKAHATGTMQTAALHERAILDMREAGVSRLVEIMEENE